MINSCKLIVGAHDISDGGLLPSLIEMLFEKRLGLDINLPKKLISLSPEKLYKLHGWCFGEDQARVLIATNKPKEIIEKAKKNNIQFFNLGIVNQSGNIKLGKYDSFSIKECYNFYENALPNMMSN